MTAHAKLQYYDQSSSSIGTDLKIWDSKFAVLVHKQLPLRAASIGGVLHKGDLE